MKKKILAFGTFDIFHKGHEFFLKEAKKYGNLEVVVAKDSTVKKVKGAFPLNNELKRLKVIQSLDYVNKAVLGNKRDKYAVIERLKPDVICLGYDQRSFTKDLKKVLKEKDLNIKIIKFKKGFKPGKYKSSKLK